MSVLETIALGLLFLGFQLAILAWVRRSKRI